MANKYISLTAIGKDKPGLVSAITGVLYEYKCNIEDSTMTILHGQFAMILILKIPSELNPKVLCNALNKKNASLEMSFSYSELPAYAPKKHKTCNPYIISVYGADKPGIVYRISSYLAENKINITDVQTTILKSKGTKTYVMIIETDMPEKLQINKISKELGELSKTMNVMVSVNRAESADL